MPFIDAHRRPAARRHTIRGAGSPARPLRRTAEQFRKRRRLAATGPTRRVQLPLQPRILVFQPPIALVQPGDLALEPFALALDALKLAPQSFPSPGLGLLLRVTFVTTFAGYSPQRSRHAPSAFFVLGDGNSGGTASYGAR